MSKSRYWFLVLLFLSFAVNSFITPVFASENTKTYQDPDNLLWLLDDQYLKESQAKESRSSHYRQVLDELENSKVPTIETAERLTEEYIKRTGCLSGRIRSANVERSSSNFHIDSVKVMKLTRCSADMYVPYIAKKGDLIWTVAANTLNTTSGDSANNVFNINAATGEVNIEPVMSPSLLPGTYHFK